MVYIIPHPLNLPEILRITLAFLEPFTSLGRRTLFACAQVNNLWADEATDILWKELSSPATSALVSLIPSGRAQIYANKVTELAFDNIGPPEVFDKLLFPRLRIIKSIDCDLICMQRLLAYAQPSLRSFTMQLRSDVKKANIGTNEAIDAVLMRLSNRCPLLQVLSLDLNGLNGPGLLRFFQKTPSIRSIHLQNSEDEMIQHLTARPNLTLLHVYFRISEQVDASAEVNQASPFSDLREIRGPFEEYASIRWTKHWRQLKTRNLTLLKSLLTAMSYFSGLRELDVVFARRSAIKTSDLISLAKGCQRLTRVSLLGSERCHKSCWPDFKDADIGDFSSLLPDLEELELDCREELSTLSVYHLGQNCPQIKYFWLETCKLDVSIFLENLSSDRTVTQCGNLSGSSQLGRTRFGENLAITHDPLDPGLAEKETNGKIRPLFPHLMWLHVDELVKPENIAIPVILSSLVYSAPRLSEVSTLSRSKFDREFGISLERFNDERRRLEKSQSNAE